jgi:hypothetical protein
VSAADLNAALDRALEKTAAARDRFRAIYRAERLEAALERARSLLAAEEDLRDGARDRSAATAPATQPPRHTSHQWSPPPLRRPPPGAVAPGTAARRQASLRVEATLLAADLEGLSRSEESRTRSWLPPPRPT